jgi:hypothetical protein
MFFSDGGHQMNEHLCFTTTVTDPPGGTAFERSMSAALGRALDLDPALEQALTATEGPPQTEEKKPSEVATVVDCDTASDPKSAGAACTVPTGYVKGIPTKKPRLESSLNLGGSFVRRFFILSFCFL